MVKTFATDANNDLYIANDGNLVIAQNLTAVLQACATAAKAQRGEMQYNLDLGIPNFDTVWNGTPNIPQFEAALRTTLLNVEGVTQIKTLTVENRSNVLIYQAEIVTVYGQGVISGDVNL